MNAFLFIKFENLIETKTTLNYLLLEAKLLSHWMSHFLIPLCGYVEYACKWSDNLPPGRVTVIQLPRKGNSSQSSLNLINTYKGGRLSTDKYLLTMK